MTFTISAKLLDACVLGIVKIEDTYGYDLTQKVGSTIEVSESALYPVLRRLSKEGLLETYDKQFDGRNRKYYRITESGLEKLTFYKNEWATYTATIGTILEGELHYESK